MSSIAASSSSSIPQDLHDRQSRSMLVADTKLGETLPISSASTLPSWTFNQNPISHGERVENHSAAELSRLRRYIVFQDQSSANLLVALHSYLDFHVLLNAFAQYASSRVYIRRPLPIKRWGHPTFLCFPSSSFLIIRAFNTTGNFVYLSIDPRAINTLSTERVTARDIDGFYGR